MKERFLDGSIITEEYKKRLEASFAAVFEAEAQFDPWELEAACKEHAAKSNNNRRKDSGILEG